jgi:hypothetical protein
MARAAAPPGARPHAGHPWLQGLACGAMLAFAPSLALLLGVLLAPAMVGMVLDRRAGRPVARAVFFTGAAFTLAPVWHLYQGGANMAAAMDLLSAPAVLAPAWLAGASGWALCEVLPVILRGAADMNATTRIAALKLEAKALSETWDLPGLG